MFTVDVKQQINNNKLPVPGRPTIRITVGQGPTALAVGAGRGCLDIFTLIYPFFPLSPSLWETARYRLKYCLKGPLNPKPTNLLIWIILGQGPTALAVSAGGGCLYIFAFVYHFSFLSPSLWETARYRLKYCLKGPLSPKQPINCTKLSRTVRILISTSMGYLLMITHTRGHIFKLQKPRCNSLSDSKLSQ